MVLKNIWPLLESHSIAARCRRDWQRLIGPEFKLWQDYLFQPRQALASSYLCSVPKNVGTVHRVIHHGGDDYVGVCPAGCPTETLARADIIIYEFHCRKFHEILAREWDIDYRGEPLADLHNTFMLGTHIARNDRHIPVFITYQGQAEDFLNVAVRLSHDQGRRFILVSPTRRLFSPACAQILEKSESIFVALAEEITSEKPHHIQVHRSLDAILAGVDKVPDRKPGRSKMSEEEFQQRKKFWSDWQSAKSFGMRKKDFCQDRGISLKELENNRRLIEQRVTRCPEA